MTTYPEWIFYPNSVRPPNWVASFTAAVAFGSEAIPGVIEGLLEMAVEAPKIAISQPSSASDLAEELYGILKAHRPPLHWEILSNIMSKERPDTGASKWAVYNCLLENPTRFDQVEEHVFAVR